MDVIESALCSDKLIAEEDLEPRVEIYLSKKILDETINIAQVKKYLTNTTWKRLNTLLEKVEEENTWDCKTSGKELDKCPLSIGCDVCLEWYHATCLGKSERPKSKTWVCRSCLRTSS